MADYQAEAELEYIIMQMQLGRRSLTRKNKDAILKAARRGIKALRGSASNQQREIIDHKRLAAGEKQDE